MQVRSKCIICILIGGILYRIRKFVQICKDFRSFMGLFEIFFKIIGQDTNVHLNFGRKSLNLNVYPLQNCNLQLLNFE